MSGTLSGPYPRWSPHPVVGCAILVRIVVRKIQVGIQVFCRGRDTVFVVVVVTPVSSVLTIRVLQWRIAAERIPSRGPDNRIEGVIQTIAIGIVTCRYRIRNAIGIRVVPFNRVSNAIVVAIGIEVVRTSAASLLTGTSAVPPASVS
ncbi:MAG: hypothetical protein R3E84_14550 [Pseudomonadales bacterium]